MLPVPMGCSWACSGFPKTSFRPATQVAKGAATASCSIIQSGNGPIQAGAVGRGAKAAFPVAFPVI